MTDSPFLETLKTRVTESQKRWQEAQHKLTVAQQEFQLAQNEFVNWQGVLQAEMRRLGQLPPVPPPPPPGQPQPQQRVLTSSGGIRVIPAQVAVANQPQPPAPNSGPPAQDLANSDVNKTELIREVLRQHPAGMTPKEIRIALKDEVSRDYVYAVLKRLKDRDQIVFQRKKRKYFMRVPQKGEESKQTILQ
jgi:hypothetical protein